MSTDGTNPENLTSSSGDDRDPAYSPTGKQIAFTSDRGVGGDNEIYRMSAVGLLQTQLTFNTVSDQEPTWQPLP